MPSQIKRALEDVSHILDDAGWDDRSGNIAGNVTNSQVGQSLTNATNIICERASNGRREMLEQLRLEVKKLIENLPQEKKDNAPQVAEDLEMLVRQATADKPNRKWYSVSAEGLLEASNWVKDFSGNIGGMIASLGKTLWPDFLLPKSG